MYIHIDTRILPPAAFLRQKTCRKNLAVRHGFQLRMWTRSPGRKRSSNPLPKPMRRGWRLLELMSGETNRNQWKKQIEGKQFLKIIERRLNTMRIKFSISIMSFCCMGVTPAKRWVNSPSSWVITVIARQIRSFRTLKNGRCTTSHWEWTSHVFPLTNLSSGCFKDPVGNDLSRGWYIYI